MNSLFHYCQGESHKLTDKPCQDCAYAESNESLSMAIVCDGHGGECYFRSQYGSEFAVEITKEAIHQFVEGMPESSWTNKGQNSVFSNKGFTSYSIASTDKEKQQDTNAHKALTWLFSSIISRWNIKIAEHAFANPLNEWELQHVEQKYQDEFVAKLSVKTASFEKTYGCTLMAYVQTPNYWFAFHLGDGKFIMMTKENNKLICSQPIPWDERCFLNKTTSLCDAQPLEEFRYCYQGDGHFPLAIFLGSDGLDDSYGDGDNLSNFYIEVYKLILRKSKEEAEDELKKSLPKISKIGSKDDMSVAAVFDDSDAKDKFIMLTDYQKDKLEDQHNEILEKINKYKEKIDAFGNHEFLSGADKINFDYASNDLRKAENQEVRIRKRQSNLKGEVTKFKNKYTA